MARKTVLNAVRLAARRLFRAPALERAAPSSGEAFFQLDSVLPPAQERTSLFPAVRTSAALLPGARQRTTESAARGGTPFVTAGTEEHMAAKTVVGRDEVQVTPFSTKIPRAVENGNTRDTNAEIGRTFPSLIMGQENITAAPVWKRSPVLSVLQADPSVLSLAGIMDHVAIRQTAASAAAERTQAWHQPVRAEPVENTATRQTAASEAVQRAAAWRQPARAETAENAAARQTAGSVTAGRTAAWHQPAWAQPAEDAAARQTTASATAERTASWRQPAWAEPAEDATARQTTAIATAEHSAAWRQPTRARVTQMVEHTEPSSALSTGTLRFVENSPALATAVSDREETSGSRFSAALQSAGEESLSFLPHPVRENASTSSTSEQTARASPTVRRKETAPSPEEFWNQWARRFAGELHSSPEGVHG